MNTANMPDNPDVVVYLKKDGTIYLNQDKITNRKPSRRMLEEAFLTVAEKKLYLKVDGELEYGDTRSTSTRRSARPGSRTSPSSRRRRRKRAKPCSSSVSMMPPCRHPFRDGGRAAVLLGISGYLSLPPQLPLPFSADAESISGCPALSSSPHPALRSCSPSGIPPDPSSRRDTRAS